MVYHTKTKILKVSYDSPEASLITQAADMIQAGGLVAFPTETVYGLGANALNAEAVAKIFAAKERPANDPIIVHIHDIAQLELVARDVPPLAYKLASHFWAGALTLILKRHPDIPDGITASQDSVAVRMPDHPVALALLRAANTPIGAPSANRFSRPSPTLATHVAHDLTERVDIILDGGATRIGVESTILDIRTTPPTILRPGGITLEALRTVVPDVQTKMVYLTRDTDIATSPGNLIKHYSPTAEVLLYEGKKDKVLGEMIRQARGYQEAGKHIGVLVRDGEQSAWDTMPIDGIHFAYLGQTATDHAQRLFAAIRDLDHSNVDYILVRAPEESGIGLAVWDRLLRAAEGHVITIR